MNRRQIDGWAHAMHRRFNPDICLPGPLSLICRWDNRYGSHHDTAGPACRVHDRALNWCARLHILGKGWCSRCLSEYDWVDDDSLSVEETERRFDALMDEAEPVEVVTRRPDEDSARD